MEFPKYLFQIFALIIIAIPLFRNFEKMQKSDKVILTVCFVFFAFLQMFETNSSITKFESATNKLNETLSNTKTVITEIESANGLLELNLQQLASSFDSNFKLLGTLANSVDVLDSNLLDTRITFDRNLKKVRKLNTDLLLTSENILSSNNSTLKQVRGIDSYQKGSDSYLLFDLVYDEKTKKIYLEAEFIGNSPQKGCLITIQDMLAGTGKNRSWNLNEDYNKDIRLNTNSTTIFYVQEINKNSRLSIASIEPINHKRDLYFKITFDFLGGISTHDLRFNNFRSTEKPLQKSMITISPGRQKVMNISPNFSEEGSEYERKLFLLRKRKESATIGF